MQDSCSSESDGDEGSSQMHPLILQVCIRRPMRQIMSWMRCFLTAPPPTHRTRWMSQCAPEPSLEHLFFGIRGTPPCRAILAMTIARYVSYRVGPGSVTQEPIMHRRRRSSERCGDSSDAPVVSCLVLRSWMLMRFSTPRFPQAPPVQNALVGHGVSKAA